MRAAVPLFVAGLCLAGCNHSDNSPHSSANPSSAPSAAATTGILAPQEHQNPPGADSSCSNTLLTKMDQSAIYSVREGLCEHDGKMEWQIWRNNASVTYSLPADEAEAILDKSPKYWGDGLVTIDLPTERGGTVVIAKWNGDKWSLQSVHYMTGDEGSVSLEYDRHILRMSDARRSGMQIYPSTKQDARK